MNFNPVNTVKTIIFLIHLIKFIYSWDLTVLGLDNTNYKLRHISRSYVRTFLCIESTNASIQIPTLIETTWPENILKICPKIYPNYKEHAVYNKNQTDCKKIQQSGWTEIDENGQLWLLDIGNKYCNPKLIIYEIWSSNNDNNLNEYNEIYRELCPFQHDTILSMKLINLNNNNNQKNIFFTFNHGKYIWIYYYYNHIWKKFKFHDENLKRIFINHITFNSNELKLLLTNNLNELYTINLPLCLNQSEIRINNIGKLMGNTNYMITDPNGILYYSLIKDGAIVRCNPNIINGLNAENHEILMLQSIPIVQIFFGVKGSVWSAMEIMINNGISGDHCQRMLYHYTLKSQFSNFINTNNNDNDNCGQSD